MKNTKKLFALLIVAVLMVSLSAVAYADNFVNSTYNAGAPKVIKAVDANGNDVTNLIVITSYKNRATLPAEQKANLEGAAAAIKGAADLGSLNGDLAAVIKEGSVACSDLFDVSAASEVSFPVVVDLEFEKDVQKNVKYMAEYKDKAFETAAIEVGADVVSVTLSGEGPVAAFVGVSAAASPATGDSVPYGFFAGALVLACAAAFFFVKSRKA